MEENFWNSFPNAQKVCEEQAEYSFFSSSPFKCVLEKELPLGFGLVLGTVVTSEDLFSLPASPNHC